MLHFLVITKNYCENSDRRYISGTLVTGAVRVKMMFPLSPVSASVTFRSRISEPIARSCITEMHMEGNRNTDAPLSTSSTSSLAILLK